MLLNFPIKSIKQVLNNNLFFLIVLVLVISISRIATWFFPLDSDHWIFFVVGKEFWEGKILYYEIWDHKPPLIFLINGLMSFAFGDSIILHRIFLTFWMLLDVFLVYLLIKHFLGKYNTENILVKTRLGTLFYAFWRNLSQFTSSGNNTENFGLVFLITMYLTYFYFKQTKKVFWLLIVGIALSVLVFLKPNFVLLTLPVWIDLIWPFFKFLARKQYKQALFCITNIGLKLFIIIIPLITQIVIWVTYFWSNNAIWDFWLASYAFNSKYLLSTWAGKVSGQAVFLLISSPFYLLYLKFLGIFILQNKTQFANQYIRFIFVSSLAGLLFIFILGSFYPYYYLILMPIFTLLVMSLDWSKFTKTSTNLIITTLMIITFSTSYLISLKQFYNGITGPVAAEASEIKQVAEFISQNTTIEDKLYGYVYGATFYVLTDRQPASKYISGNILVLDYRENYGFGLNEKVIHDLQITQPPLIILYTKNNIYESNHLLMNYFNTCYKDLKLWVNYKIMERIDCDYVL